MGLLSVIILAAMMQSCVAQGPFVNLLTFDGHPGTTAKRWQLTNDPVMGGVSFSTWAVNETVQLGIWNGTVKIVPSLNAPGFCNIMTNTGTWPSAAGFDQLEFRVRSTQPYKGYKVSFAANTLNPQFDCFKADFTMANTGEWEDIVVPFNGFSNDWSKYTG